MTPQAYTYNSLQHRYAAAAGALAVAVLVGAYLADRNLTGARTETAANIETRSEVLERSRHVRDAVWQARENLATFLLTPAPDTRRAVHVAVRQALAHTARLGRHPWLRARNQEEAVRQLSEALRAFDRVAASVMATRVDATRQYPALAYGRGSMLPDSREFTTAVGLALEEHAGGRDYGTLRSEAFGAFIQARHWWSQMTSTFRMYLANRLGSFSEESLSVQERDIELQYEELNRWLQRLQGLKAEGALSLQGGVSLEQMQAAANGWYPAFLEVKRIHHSEGWRTDALQIKRDLVPVLASIWKRLQSLDASIERSTVQDVQSMTAVAQTQSRMLWLMTALALSFIVGGYVALERWVLRPIATVAHALKSEASGVANAALPNSNIRETRDLVDAFSEMRQQVYNRQQALEHQALHDALTELPNRSLLMDRLQQAIYSARRENSPLALLMMDLDRFKEINDTLGHHVGDRLLQQVAARLLGTLRESDTVARLGGDEFAILLPHTSIEDARHLGSRTLNTLEQVFSVDGHQLYIGASIGIAAYPHHGTSGQTLIQRADVAMYVAKRNKLSQSVYDPSEDQHSVGRLALMSDLRTALDDDSLELYYQPKLRLNNGQVVGVEALLRWRHPERGAIRPDELVPLAEQTGLIKPLSMWVVDRAVRQAAQWRDKGIELNIAVNLSVYNLQDAALILQLRECLDRHRLPPRYLSLEVTESAMMSDPVHAVEVLSALDAMGVRLAIDDFGSGFSSLGYLKQLPVDELKIDKSFVMDMHEDENDAVIVRSIIDLAHNLGLTVIAEGVETADIWEVLNVLRCDHAQGYYMSRPLPAQQLEQWLEQAALPVAVARTS